MWDFTCVHTISRSHLKEACKQPGAAAEKVKNDKYKNLQRDYYLVAIAVEALVAWKSAGATLIKTLGKIIREKTGEKRSTFFLFQSISMAVQRGNAASILGTIKNGEKLDKFYYL